MHRYNSIINAAADILFPFDVSCSLCGREEGMGNGAGICTICEASLPRSENVSNIDMHACHSLFLHQDGPRTMIIQLKFNGQKHYARTLAYYMAQYLLAQPILRDADVLVPIPLHKAKFKERGFNQSTLICYALTLLCGIPTDEKLIQRTKNTRPQTELSAKERKENVKDAFSIMGDVAGKKVIVIDDVFTTGSTMGECLKALDNAGAKCVGLTAAKAVEGLQSADK